MALTESQVYQLNMLTYAGHDGAAASLGIDARGLMQDVVQSGGTVREYVEALRSAYGDNETKYSPTFDKILQDDTLCSMTIANYQQMEGSESNMIVFASSDNSEAVVAFEGSQSGADWRDNFDAVGGTNQPDGVSTEFQQKALDYVNSHEVSEILSQYDTVTATGHSKGGNNASYVTILSDNVDRCISFDAPGYSDEFVEKYKDEIARKQDAIENYSADTDYVNILQNSIGEQHYIRTELPDNYHDCVDGEDAAEFFLAHDPTAIEKYFYEDAPLVQQEPGLKALDEMLNSYLRYADDEDKKEAAALVGDLLSRFFYDGFDDLDLGDYVNMVKEYGPEMLDFLGYISSYLAANPDKAQQILEAIRRSHPFLAKIIEGVIKSDLVQFFVKKFRPDPSDLPNGDDIHLESVGRHDRIEADTNIYSGIRRKLSRMASDLSSCQGALISCANQCDNLNFTMSITLTLHFFLSFKRNLMGRPETVLRRMASSIDNFCNEVESMARTLSRVIELLEDTEYQNLGLAEAMNEGLPAPYAL